MIRAEYFDCEFWLEYVSVSLLTSVLDVNPLSPYHLLLREGAQCLTCKKKLGYENISDLLVADIDPIAKRYNIKFSAAHCS